MANITIGLLHFHSTPNSPSRICTHHLFIQSSMFNYRWNILHNIQKRTPYRRCKVIWRLALYVFYKQLHSYYDIFFSKWPDWSSCFDWQINKVTRRMRRITDLFLYIFNGIVAELSPPTNRMRERRLNELKKWEELHLT